MLGFAHPACSLYAGKDLLTALLFLQDAILVVFLVSCVDDSLLLEQLLQTKVLLSEHHGFLAGLNGKELLVLVLASGLERSLCIEQLVSSLEILALTLIVVVKQHTCLVVLVIDLLEVAILAATHFLLLNRALKLGQVALVANQEGISPQVLIGVEIVRLDRLARVLLAEELHLSHLILGEALGVTVVWVGVRQGLDWASISGRGWPRLNRARVCSLLSIQVVE